MSINNVGPFSAQIERAIAALLSGGTSGGTVFTGTVTATRFLSGDGSAAAPAFGATSAAMGFFFPTSSHIAWSIAGVKQGTLTAGIRLLDGAGIGWSSDPGVAATNTQITQVGTRTLTLGPTTGVTLRWATDGLLEVRNFANSSYGEIRTEFFNAGSTGAFYWPTRTMFRAPGAGQATLTNSGETLGIGLDFATDAILKVRTRAQTGDASVTARNYTASGYVEGTEIAAPAAPAANGYRIFAQDNGAGKTQLMVLFASGAAQQIAIEP